VTTINENAFEVGWGIVPVTLPSNLPIIKRYTFRNCPDLKSIIIFATVGYIYQEAFAGCSSLEAVNVLATEPPFLYDNSFSDYGIPLNVPEGCKQGCYKAQGWRNFTTINDGNIYYQLSLTADKHGAVSCNDSEDVTDGQLMVGVKEALILC